jgi:hypothetical protein
MLPRLNAGHPLFLKACDNFIATRRGGHFGFDITGPATFSDLQSPHNPKRFYRLRSP